MSRIVLGFSGGVDSAVSAMLLKNAGHEVIGLYMDNTDENALRDAVETAEFAGIELEVADVRAALEENVCRPFTDCYLRGETPNPCVICNPSVKFKTLLSAADRRGAELVATGHYARAENGAIYKGRPSNDQTYMLCRLTREQAARAVTSVLKSSSHSASSTVFVRASMRETYTLRPSIMPGRRWPTV